MGLAAEAGVPPHSLGAGGLCGDFLILLKHCFFFNLHNNKIIITTAQTCGED